MPFISATTINQVMDHVFTDTFFKGYCNSFSLDKYVGEEIFGEFCLTISNQPQDKIIDLYNRGEFNYYSVTVIKNLIKNPYSPIQKNIFKHTNVSAHDEIEEEDLIPDDMEEFELIENKVSHNIELINL